MRRLLLLLAFFVLGACERPAEQRYKTKILSFGTYVDVTLTNTTKHRADTAIEAIEAQLDYMHNQWHAWRPSVVTELNQQLQGGQWFKPDMGILPLVKQSQRLYRQSNGYFNPAIGKLIELWGFYKDSPQNNIAIPAKASVESLVSSNPNMDDIEINGDQVRGLNSDIQLDFGGYAKGFGVEQLIKQLRMQGFNDALINAGGDLKVIGEANGRPWKIALRDPISQKPMAWLLAESGESIFSSGDYIRYYQVNGKRYHHIINPETGYPSEGTHAVTVIAQDAAVADAAATALMIAPKAEWLSLAKQMQLKHFMLIDSQGQLYCDDLFAKRLQLLNDQPLTLVGRL